MGEKIEFFKYQGGYVRFYLTVDKLEDYFAEVSVFEVSSWSADETKTYDDGELYLTAYIKWDGCSHVIFSEEGYKHLCGKYYWEEHGKMMLNLYEVVTSKIKSYDKSVAE